MSASQDTQALSFDEELGVYATSSYSAAQQVLHGQHWSSDPGGNFTLLAKMGTPDSLPSLVDAMLRLFMDGPTHTRMRQFLARSFTARRIEALRPRISAVVEAALEGVQDRPAFDALADLAYPIPTAVIAELLDVGTEGAQIISACSEQLTALMEIGPTETQLLAAGAASTTCSLFLLPLLAERRESPGEDFISALLTADVDGDRLTLEEALANILLLLIAGRETTANLIGNGVLRLLRHPAELDLVRADPELIGVVVEEILRLDAPIKFVARTATRDQYVGRQQILAGQQVVVHLASANRDPAEFPHPDRFNMHRTNRGHVSFGGGAHHCIGRALAIAEAEETLRALFTRFPHLSLADQDLRRRPSKTFHALERLLVTPS
ncbi:cytochrome P450 [Nonomuraea polychroma]|uniref:cytochrome P450 n=1 Tax=Nonomuraea polychroma TaxID=46176 RepID=UPI003D8D6836